MISCDLKRKIAVVIPACREYPSVLETIASVSEKLTGHDGIIILVVNNSCSAPIEVKKNNFMTIDSVKTCFPEVTVLDRCKEGNCFSEKEAGVGSARKAGFEEACRFLGPDDIMVSLDADITLCEGFFGLVVSEYKKDPALSGLTVDTVHEFPEDYEVAVAMVKYEIYLRYYHYALLTTGNPYIFWPVGSSMTFRKKAFLAVGGFNRRKAGEDFYFLRKLIYHGKVKHASKIHVSASPRISVRTPYGTAASVRALYEHRKNLSALPSPEIFAEIACHYKAVKRWRVLLPDSGFSPSCGKIAEFLNRYRHDEVISSALSNSSNPRNFMKIYYKWFDPLRIRQFVNFDKRTKPLPAAVGELCGIFDGDEKKILEKLRKTALPKSDF